MRAGPSVRSIAFEGVRWKMVDTAIAAIVESHDSAGLGVAVVVGRGGGATRVLATAVADGTRTGFADVKVLSPAAP